MSTEIVGVVADVPAAGDATRAPSAAAAGADDGRGLPLALLVLTIVAGGYALLFLASGIVQSPVRLVDRQLPGLDFRDFRTAAADALAGLDPYLRARFVTPPPSWLPFVPFAPLPLAVAVPAFLAANVAALAAGVALLVRHHRLGATSAVAVALTCALSPSTVMLLDRGNVDGLVFLLTCLALTLRPDRWAAPLSLAAATCLKLYPGILVAALAAHGRVRAAAVAGAAILMAVAAMPLGDLAFVHGQVVRAGGMRLDENIGALTPFWLLDHNLAFGDVGGVPVRPFTLMAVLAYGAALCACLLCDARLAGRVGEPDRRLLMASYAGFFLGLPSLVYLYSGVCLLIPLAALAQRGLRASPLRLNGMAVAIGLAMVPARSLDLTVGGGWAWDVNIVPTIGTLLFIVEATRLRFDFLARTGGGWSGPAATAGAGTRP